MPTTNSDLGQDCHSPQLPQLAFTSGVRTESTTCCEAQGKGKRWGKQGLVTKRLFIDFLLLKHLSTLSIQDPNANTRLKRRLRDRTLTLPVFDKNAILGLPPH